jgi:hypothetical protein
VGNKKQEGITALVVLKAQDIPNSNVLLCLDGEDIAYVASINHTPKVWIIHTPQVVSRYEKQPLPMYKPSAYLPSSHLFSNLYMKPISYRMSYQGETKY